MKQTSAALLLGLLIALSAAPVTAGNGDIFTPDFTSGTVYRISPSGGASVFASGLDGPEGVAFDQQGNVFVSETGAGKIYRYRTDGTRTTFATGLNGPASLVFAANGDLFDADFFGGVIYRFTPSGTRTTFATGLNGPANLIFDAAGNLLVADFNSGNIYRFAPDGTRSTFASSTGRPHGLAFDASGNLFVADFQGGTISRFTSAGARSTFATGLNGPHGIAFNASGDLFVADYNSGNVYRFTPAGTRTTLASGLTNPDNVVFEPGRPSANNLLNLSTRAFVGTQNGVLIGGFILQGSQPSTLVLRAIGPSLTASGVSGAVQNPSLQLFDASGGVLQANDDWQSGPDAAALRVVGLAPGDPREAAMRVTLPSGAYTFAVNGAGDSTGVGLVELYDLQQSTSRAGNISTRGNVLSGDGVMIAGCIVGGTQSKEIVVRALGPSLRDHGVDDALADPRLQFVDANGVVIAANDDWQQGADAGAIQSRGLAPESAAEAALRVTISAGAYTAIASPAPESSGIGLIEIYDLSPAP